jgi:type I restriction enzyme S subunit
MELITRTLGDICDEVGGVIRTGPFGSQLHESDYKESGVPVVMPKNILDGVISTEDIAYIGEGDANRLSQHRLKEGDIVYGRRGDIGRRALIAGRESGWLCGTGCIRISLSDSVLDPRFLYYYLGQPNVIEWIYNQAIGATLPNLNTAIIRSITIEYPLLPTQRKIAAILSAYDDLIENNTRRIKILEEMAQALYREWFVYFRFPGHEKVQMWDSPLGRIPEGWEVGRLDDALILQRGFDLPVKQRRAGRIPVYAATGIVGTHDEPKVKGPGVVTGRSGSLGSVMYVEEDFWPLNTTLWVKYFSKVTPIYAFYLLNEFELTSFNSGAAVPTLNRNDIHGCQVIIPSQEVLEKFDSHVLPLFMMKRILNNLNINLRSTRDLLLPRLISWEG